MLLMRGLTLGVIGSILLIALLPFVVPRLRYACGQAARWGVTVGLVAFLGGIFGPILLTPGSNQGPLLGIFFTGPAGFVVGTVAGFAFAVARGERARRSA